jgi:hypothetical protein
MLSRNEVSDDLIPSAYIELRRKNDQKTDNQETLK